jgi:hypothetical protein
MHKGFRLTFNWLLSPDAPQGLVVVPGTVAWERYRGPFLLIRRLEETKQLVKEEIKPI